jgi:hypothetical protein
MNTKIYSITLAALVLAAVSCKKEASKEPGQMAKADWFLGSWENKTPQGELTENWVKANDSVFNGESYFIKGKDTLFSETVVLAEKGGAVLYTATAKGQNDDLPVAFKMTSATAKQLVFENPAHDFPNKITYRQITKDSIVAQISGIQDGKPALEQYPMGRKK